MSKTFVLYTLFLSSFCRSVFSVPLYSEYEQSQVAKMLKQNENESPGVRARTGAGAGYDDGDGDEGRGRGRASECHDRLSDFETRPN